MSERLEVQVAGLSTWLAGAGKNCWDLRLFLDDQRIEALQADDCDFDKDLVSFQLFRIDRAKEAAWSNILQKRDGFTARVDISVGFSGDGAHPLLSDPKAKDVEMVLVEIGQALAAVIAILGSLALFFYLMGRSNIVRDSGPEPPEGKRRPYSLARVQSAFWFFLILSGYLFISVLVSSNVDIPASCLGLMGIAAGTFVGAELIDSGKRSTKADATAKTGLDQVGAASKGFMRDLLSDPSGVALHRFQMFVWTLVLGGVFAIRVWNRLAMPDFDPTLLGLMGISAGTYVGMKVPDDTAKK